MNEKQVENLSHSMLYEFNTVIFLNQLRDHYHRPLTLLTVSDEIWDNLSHKGFDYIWLMGVWQRSAVSQAAARQLLPEYLPSSITGSPYAVYDYQLDKEFGKKGDLPKLREKLSKRDLKLILDFVPNHVAIDHPWIQSHPERLLRVTKRDGEEQPDLVFTPNHKNYFVYGRDPHFAPWTDTAQVNFFSPDLRQAWIDVLLRIAEVSDGVRCDMAMLAINRIFKQTWKKFLRSEKEPAQEFWTEIISAVKKKFPRFIFMAESYWNTEWELQQMGFDFTYDKTLYDRLRYSWADDIRAHLQAEHNYQKKLVRFIENHDELRALTVFGKYKSFAAAVVQATIPGMSLFYDGQFEGWKTKWPVQLTHATKEVTDPESANFYQKLLEFCHSPILQRGEWKLMDVYSVWPETDLSYQNILAWRWRYQHQWKIVVVNYSETIGRAYLSDHDLFMKKDKTILLKDKITEEIYYREEKGLHDTGLYIELSEWGIHLFEQIID